MPAESYLSSVSMKNFPITIITPTLAQVPIRKFHVLRRLKSVLMDVVVQEKEEQ